MKNMMMLLLMNMMKGMMMTIFHPYLAATTQYQWHSLTAFARPGLALLPKFGGMLLQLTTCGIAKESANG